MTTGRLTETAGDGEQLGGWLGNVAVDAVDQNKNFRHVLYTPDRLLRGRGLR